MSASYVVFRTPHSRWIMASYPLDDAFAEDAIGPDHQGDDHEHVGREVLGATADVGVHVAGGDVLHEADDQAADDGARNRGEPAEDHDREHLEAHQREVHVNAQHAAPKDPAEGGDDPRHRPREPEVPLDVDAHGHGDLLVVGHRPHRDTLARLEEEIAEAAEEDETDDAAEELDRRNEERAEDERLAWQRGRPPAGSLGESPRAQSRPG